MADLLGRIRLTSYVPHLQDFVAVVVDDFDGNLAGLGGGEGAADGAVEGLPGGLIDFGAEGALEFLVRFVGDEPAGNVIGAYNIQRWWFKHRPLWMLCITPLSPKLFQLASIAFR